VRSNEPELLKKIAGGDWGDDTQSTVDEAVKRYAEDFGYDLDEEGHPLEDNDENDGERRRDSGRSEEREEQAQAA
jgi:F-type H+-transporting ATPase subunit alpha